MQCSVSTCDATAAVRGMCSKHYARKYRDERKRRDMADNPHDYENGRKRPDSAPRRWIRENAGHTGDACLIWPFRREKNGRPIMGAGSAISDGKRIYNKPDSAAFVMYCAAFGNPFETLTTRGVRNFVIRHTCGNAKGGCVNPHHMELIPTTRAKVQAPASKPIIPWSLPLVERIAEMSLVSDPVDIFRELTKRD